MIIRYVLYYISMGIFVVIFFVSTAFYSFVLNGKYVDKLVPFILRRFFKITCFLFNIKFVVEGAEKLTHPVVLLPKHESTYDVAIMMSFCGEPCFVMKKEYHFPPFFGIKLSTEYGALRVERDQWVSSIRKMIDFARKSLDSGRHFVVFPEGSRSKPGEMVNIKGGSFLLYKYFDCDFVPIKIENSGKCFGSGIVDRKSPGIVKVTVQDPLPKGLNKGDFIAAVTKSIGKDNSHS